MKSRFKAQFSKGFENFLKRNFTEHHARIVKSRRSARWALFNYPIGISLLFEIPIASITVAVALLYQNHHPRIADILSPDSAQIVLPILYTLCGAFALCGLVVGVSMGLAKASQMIFQSEQYEMQVRQTYYLRQMLQAERRSKKGKKTAGGSASGSSKGVGGAYSLQNANPGASNKGSSVAAAAQSRSAASGLPWPEDNRAAAEVGSLGRLRDLSVTFGSSDEALKSLKGLDDVKID